VDYVKCKDLDSYYEVSQGVVEAVDKISNKALKKIKDDKFKAGEGVFVLNKKEKNELSLKDDEKNVIKKYLNPNNVEKYKINFRDEFLIYADKQNKELIKNNKFSNLKKHLDRMKKFITSSNKPYGLHRSREDHDTNEAKFFDNPKLICMCMFDKPSFAYDEDKYYVGMSFSVIIQKDLNYSLKYLLGLLNSKFGEYWFNKHGKRRGIGVDIGVQVFRLFPVYPATSEQQKEIEKIVNELTDIKSKINDNTKVEQKSKLELDFASKEIKLNDYIYKIYGFIPEEIEIIKETTK
jgi:adenine-specific DNA-methyltransferase